MALGPRTRRDLGVIAAVLACALLLYPGALLHGESFFARDLHLDWYPRMAAIERCVRELAWPLWDPSIGFGQPLLGDPGTETAYPLTWLCLLVPLSRAYTVFVLAHLVLAGLGTERLARRLGAGRLGSLLAAGFFVLSGPLQSAVNLWHHFAGACWLPWVVLAAERASRRPRPRATALLALVAGLQLLAGSADVCAMTWVIVGAWASLRAWARAARGRALRPMAAAIAGGALLAAALAAVVWLPAADLVSRSARRDLSEDVRTASSVPAAGLLRVVAPLDSAHVPYEPGTWTRLYDRPEVPLLDSLYLGVPLLGLALLPLGSRLLRRRAALLWAWAAVALLLSMGPHGPLYGPLAVLVPPLRVFRYPSKATLPLALAVALAAGLGAAWLARRRPGRSALAWVAALAVVVGLGATWAAAGFRPWPASVIVAALACAGLLALARARRLDTRLAALLLGALGSADLLAAHSTLNPTAPPSVIFEPPPLVARAAPPSPGARLYVYDYHTLPGTSQRLLGRPDPYRTALPPPDVEPRVFAVAALRLYLPPPAAGLFGIESSYDLDIRGLYPRDLNDLTHYLRLVEGTPVHTRLLRMGGVGRVVSLHRAGLEALVPDGSLPSLFPEPILLWRVPGVVARAWVVGCARVADAAQSFRALADPAFDPAAQVILPAPTGTGPGCGAAGAADVLSTRSDRLRIATDTPGGGYLVIANAWDPGWHATVDGGATPLLRANVAFQAVALPPGRHSVSLEYRPRAVLWGAAVSLLALVGVLGLARVSRSAGSPGPARPRPACAAERPR